MSNTQDQLIEAITVRFEGVLADIRERQIRIENLQAKVAQLVDSMNQLEIERSDRKQPLGSWMVPHDG
jgi:cell division septum initiation protein DivIVA